MVKNDFNNSAGCSQELHNWWPRYFRLFCPVLVWGKRNSNCAISSFLSEKSMSREKYMRTAEEDIKKTTHSFLLRGCRFLPSFICAISLRFASMHVLDIRLGTSMKFYIGPLPLFTVQWRTNQDFKPSHLIYQHLMNKPQLTDNPKLQDTHSDRFIMVVPSKVFMDRMTVLHYCCINQKEGVTVMQACVF